MAASLYEVVRVLDDIVVPDFVMDMRASAASRRADAAKARALGQISAHLHADGGEMAIAGVEAIAVIDLPHIAIAATIAGEHHGARRRGMHHAAPGAGEINAGMEGEAAGEGID